MLDLCANDRSQCLVVAARTHGTALETDKHDQDRFNPHARESAARKQPNQSATSAKLIPAFFEANFFLSLILKETNISILLIRHVGTERQG